jgi:Na+/H+ antiporter NhaD/arsenite permease-like protein
MARLGKFASRNAMPIIALAGAIVTMFFVTPDSHYLEYIDYKTLLSLFSFMAVIAAFKDIKIFRLAASLFLKKFKHERGMVLALVFITYFFSMFIANDMALLTFLPFTLSVFRQCGNKKLAAFTIIMQNIAANLGGMLTPFGNPQNLYLYSYFEIPTGEFMKIMALPFIISAALIILICMIIKNKPLNAEIQEFERPPKSRIIVYTALFVAAALTVLRIIPYYICYPLIIVILLIMDYKAFKGVDYSLLITFFAFFILSGNLSHISQVKEFLVPLIEQNTLLYSILSCQIISNVPTAVMFSYVTPRELYPGLLLGVNLGGLGTIVASLASLISLRAFSKEYKGSGGYYLGLFSIINFSILALLYLITSIILF